MRVGTCAQMAIREPNVVVPTHATQYLSECLLCTCAVATARFNPGGHVRFNQKRTWTEL
jgi:hypothetical protein